MMRQKKRKEERKKNELVKTFNVIKNGLSKKKPAIKIASALGVRVWNLLDRTLMYRRAKEKQQQQPTE